MFFLNANLPDSGKSRLGRAMMEFGIFAERARQELGLARHSSNPFFKAEHLRGARSAASHAREWLAIAREAHAEA